MSVNQVHLLGRCGQDPEIRSVGQNNVNRATFSLCTGSKYKTHDGREVDDTAWHNIVAWRGLADLAEKYIRKGSPIFIEGQIRTRSWTDQAGAKQYRTEIVANAIQLLGKKQDNPANQAVGGQTWSQPQNGPQAGFQQQSAQPQPAAPEYPSSGEVMDDLPF